MMAVNRLRRDSASIKERVAVLMKYDDKTLAIGELKSLLKSYSGDSEQLNQLSEALSTLHAQQSSFRKLFKELQRSHVSVQQLSSHQHECGQALDYGISRQKALFEKCCGLKFKLTEDQAVTLEFQHLSQNHMEAVCSVTIDINAEGLWEVVQLSPHVPGVAALLDTLNKNKSLTQFCKHMRLKFKQHVLTLS